LYQSKIIHLKLFLQAIIVRARRRQTQNKSETIGWKPHALVSILTYRPKKSVSESKESQCIAPSAESGPCAPTLPATHGIGSF
jgi:hypothetical protein